MKKYIIGLGCSWTQGEGGYPKEVVDEHNGYTQIRGRDDYYLRKYELENSWVNQLARDHFPDHIPVNLGIKGIGNYAAVNQLHYLDQHDISEGTGIIILMLSGLERLDFFRRDPRKADKNKDPDFYSDGYYEHLKWRTAWPYEIKQGDSVLWNVYARELWSEVFVANNTMMTLLNLQNYAKSINFELVVANAFNGYSSGVYEFLKEHCQPLVNKFDWSCYLHNTTDYSAFMEKLVLLDGKIPDWRGFHSYYNPDNLKTHSEYLTNDEGAHPTIKGYKVIADELAKFINSRNYDKKENSQLRQSQLSARP
jgi:hypothetical protein